MHQKHRMMCPEHASSVCQSAKSRPWALDSDPKRHKQENRFKLGQIKSQMM